MLDRVIQALLLPRSYCGFTYSTIIDLRERMFHDSYRAFARTQLSLSATLIPRPQNVRLNAMFGHPEFDLFEAIYTTRSLSLIHISEPTRQAEISYAVFC